MKKIIRKISVVMLCLAMAMASLSYKPYQVIAIEDTISVEDIDVEYFNKQAESIEQYKKLLNAFNTNSKTRTGDEQVYDSNYGGAYIDDNGELVVLLTCKDVDSVEKVMNYTETEELQTQSCKYSYNELLLVINSINNNLGFLDKRGIIISEMHEDIYQNRVCIGVINLTEEKENIIRSIVNSNCMYIYNLNAGAIQNTGVDVKGGDEIYGIDDGTISTVGFCATRNGVEGFVIAGHAGDVVGEMYMVGQGTIMGTVTATAYYNNSTADAAFVSKSYYANTTNRIGVYSCKYLATDISSYPIGATICKYGRTTGHTVGKLETKHTTTTYEGIYLTEQCSADFETASGDSGGPVFIVEGVVNGKVTCRLLGVISRHFMSYGDAGYSAFFSKYMHIEDELDVTAITN